MKNNKTNKTNNDKKKLDKESISNLVELCLILSGSGKTIRR
jgi:hypothetical protein